MNERIKQLAARAGIVRSIDTPMYLISTESDLEKFAELIVQECLNQCSNYGGDATLVANHVARKIETHFGVK